MTALTSALAFIALALRPGYGCAPALAATIAKATIRAFADDMATVVPDPKDAIPKQNFIFGEVERDARLELNLAKCVDIPLWPDSLGVTRAGFAR